MNRSKNDIRSLADELRNKSRKPDADEHAILTALKGFDTTANKSMVHARFDAGTLRMMNHFKLATGVDVSRLVAFAVKELFDQHPELKEIIKQFIQNLEL